MKTSLNWLKDYTDIPWSAQELADRLTTAGLEPEGIETTGTIPQGVIVAEILSRVPHPNSDHMSICMVNPGSGEPLQIVCGAPNCDAGCRVPLAPIGTDFGGGFVIKKSKLRGVDSCGMMCSAKELGLSEDHTGLLILPKDTPLGKSVRELYQCDTVIDWEVTPNRPDWLSHIGIAREICALSGNKLHLPEPHIKIRPGSNAADYASIRIDAPEFCPRYIGRVFANVKIGPSPDWMRKRLEAVGLRSINNVVDITNYIMLEFGQPLHAFDLNHLDGHQIIVRRAADGEEITTLDGAHLKLNHENLLIADKSKGVAIAGIMGGENSMITDDTTEVLIEAAAFDRTNIRLSSRALNKATDASYTYERGVSPETAALASARAASLLCELCGAEQLGEAIDCYPRPWQSETITCKASRINALLGVKLTPEEIAANIAKRGIEIKSIAGDEITVGTPWWRFDLHAPVDFVEEVAQMMGLDAIPEIAPVALLGGSAKDDKYFATQQLRERLSSLGLDEIMNYTMWSSAQCLAGTALSESDLLTVSNPISSDAAFLRPTLLPGLLQVVEHNVCHSQHDLAFFEIGRVFKMVDGKPTEHLQAGIAMTGHLHPELFGKAKDATVDFYTLKGVVEGLLDAYGLAGFYRCEACEHPAFKKGVCAKMVSKNHKDLVWFGQIQSSLIKNAKMRSPLFVALADTEAIAIAPHPAKKYTELPQFPAVERDISFLAPLSLTNQQVIDAVASLKIPGIVKVQLFDQFTDHKILGADKRSLAYTITYRDPARTLTDDEVNRAQEALRAGLVKKLGVELR
jgi:phenylalanyl-tRNA synthetase beta chain